MTDATKIFTRNFIVDELRKRIFGTVFLVLVSVLIWLFSPIRDQLHAMWQGPVVIAQLKASTEASFKAQAEQIATLTELVRNINGENRVIRQTPGQSYVTEPVTVGQPVTLNLVAQRTALGATCKLTNSQSLFTDTSGVAAPGRSLGQKRQITTDPTRLRVLIQPPRKLLLGRIEVYLALEYECSGKTVFDRTDPVYYTLLEDAN